MQKKERVVRATVLGASGVLAVALALTMLPHLVRPQQSVMAAGPQQSRGVGLAFEYPGVNRNNVPTHTFDWRSGFPRWSLPAGDGVYGSPSLDGSHLKELLNEFTAIGVRYRDAGHQYWGRITGTDGDVWNRQWVVDKFKAAGLQDVVDVPMDLTAPQWLGDSWKVTATGSEGPMPLTSAQPFVNSSPTPAGGIDVEPVWVGLGSEADFKGRDVRGKAAVIFTYMYGFTSSARYYGGIDRAAKAGAASILVMNNVPGNLKIVGNLGGVGGNGQPTIKVPVFSIGMQDGEALRQRIEAGPLKLHISLASRWVSGLKSGNVWGTLPGKSKEEIILDAHRDGYFMGAGDDASGISVLVGLAEYFAKIPQDRRPLTIKFLASTGHHCNGLSGPKVIVAEKEKYLSNAVFYMNLEHVAWTTTWPMTMGVPQPYQEFTTDVDARRWYVFGSDKVATAFLNTFREFGIGLYANQDKGNPGEGGPFSYVLPNIGFISSPVQMHTDADTPDMVPATGLEQIARATAKLVTELSRMPKADLAPQTVEESKQ